MRVFFDRVAIQPFRDIRRLSLRAWLIIIGTLVAGLLGVLVAAALIAVVFSRLIADLVLAIGVTTLALTAAGVMHRDLYDESVRNALRRGFTNRGAAPRR